MKLGRPKFILTLLITVAILIFIFSRIDFIKVIAAFKNIKWRWIILPAGISLFINTFIGVRFRRILKPMGCNLSFKEAIWLRIATFPIKSVAPVKSGELVKPLYLKKQYNFSLLKGSSAILVQLFFGLLVLFLYVLGGCLAFRMNPYGIGWISGVVVGLGLMGIIFLRKPLFIFSAKIHPKIYNTTKNLLNAFESLKLSDLLIIFVYSILFVGGQCLVFYFLARSINLSIPLSKILIFVPVTLIIASLPITIQGCGTREAAIMFFFSMFGSKETLFDLSVLFFVVEWLFPIGVGLFFTRSFLNKL